MTGERRGKRVGDLPDWAMRLYEDYGSPKLEDLGDVFHGPLMDRKSGLRKDDIIEVLLDRRMLPEGREPWVRGMLIGTTLPLRCGVTMPQPSRWPREFR